MAMRRFSAIGWQPGRDPGLCDARPLGGTRIVVKAGRDREIATRPRPRPARASADSNNAPTEIVIHRRRIHLRGSRKIPGADASRAGPHGAAGRSFDGTVKSILHKPGQHLESAAEVIRMDMTEKQLRLDRAKALYQVAKLEDDQASGNGKAAG